MAQPKPAPPSAPPGAPADSRLEVSRGDPESLLIRLTGRWVLSRGLPDIVAAVEHRPPLAALRRITLDATGLQAWDSLLIAELRRLKALCIDHEIALDLATLPDGARHLIELASAVAPRRVNRRSQGRLGFRTAVGVECMRAARSTTDMVSFL